MKGGAMEARRRARRPRGAGMRGAQALPENGHVGAMARSVGYVRYMDDFIFKADYKAALQLKDDAKVSQK